MQRYCFTVRSITDAMQAQELLKQAGIRASMLRAPSSLRTNGCGYCLQVGQESCLAAESILSKDRKRYQKLYRLDGGTWQEMKT